MAKNIFILLVITGTCFSESLESVSKEIGQQQDFSINSPIFLTPQKSWDGIITHNNRSWRSLKASMASEILIESFSTDSNGFCLNDMVLEVEYFDKKENYDTKPPIILSELDYTEKNEYFEIGHLPLKGTNAWITEKVLIPRTHWQMIRAIDGAFRFKIDNTKNNREEINISKITLCAVSKSEMDKLAEMDRSERGFVRKVPLNKSCDGIESGLGGLDFYSVNNLELIFQNADLTKLNRTKSLNIFQIPGQVGSATLLVISDKNLEKVKVEASSLETEDSVIKSNNITIQPVEYMDQRLGFMTSRYYARVPDHLGPVQSSYNFKSREFNLFRITVNVPPGSKSGKYKSKILFGDEGIELNLEVLPVKLSDPVVYHMIYHSPYMKRFHPHPNAVLEDMTKHGLIPILYPGGVIDPHTFAYKKNPFGNELINLKKYLNSNSKQTPVFAVLFNYNSVWSMVNGPNPPFKKSYKPFEENYARVLSRVRYEAEREGFDLYVSFQDEPFRDIQKRSSSYICSKIAQEQGIKTWAAHNLNDDIMIDLGTPALAPLREVLDVFVEAVIRIDGQTQEKLKNYKATLAYYTTYLATGIRPLYNRFLHGIFAQKAGVKFVVSYAYRDSIVNPYDDFDVEYDSPWEVGMGDYLLTYPTWSGEILPTLSYEEIPEGIEDCRLISTLKNEIEKGSKSNNYEIQKISKEADLYLSRILARIKIDFKNAYWSKHKDLPVDPMEKNILKDLNEDGTEDYNVFNKIRWDVCQYIMKLQNT